MSHDIHVIIPGEQIHDLVVKAAVKQIIEGFETMAVRKQVLEVYRNALCAEAERIGRRAARAIANASGIGAGGASHDP